MRPIAGMMRGTSRDRYSKVAQQQGVEPGHEAGAEQERPVADRDERLPDGDERGRVRSGAGQVLSQGHDRQEADDADRR